MFPKTSCGPICGLCHLAHKGGVFCSSSTSARHFERNTPRRFSDREDGDHCMHSSNGESVWRLAMQGQRQRELATALPDIIDKQCGFVQSSRVLAVRRPTFDRGSSAQPQTSQDAALMASRPQLRSRSDPSRQPPRPPRPPERVRPSAIAPTTPATPQHAGATMLGQLEGRTVPEPSNGRCSARRPPVVTAKPPES